MSGLVILCTSSMFSAKISTRQEATQGGYGQTGGKSSSLCGWLVEGESKFKCPHAYGRQWCQLTVGITPCLEPITSG